MALDSATAQMDAVSQSNFEFSNALLEKLTTGSENLVLSPFSLSLILLLARLGARGRTGAQIEQVLRLPRTERLEDLEQTQITFRGILEKIQTPTDDSQVTVANKAYMQKDFRFSEDFKLSRYSLQVGLGRVNFTDGSGASDRINSWVMNKTEGKCRQLFSPDSFSADTKLVLVNAIYFKSPWKYPFEPERTRKAPFYMRPGEKTIVDMMVIEDKFPYGNLAALNAKIVSIPYKGDRFSMQVIIPKGGKQQTIEDLLVALKGIKMNRIQASLRTPGNCEEVRLHLPKFKIESKHDLVEPLKQMGATDMFSTTEADFSGIPKGGKAKLSVSEVIQKAYISVDEEGTEAAAATGMQVGVMCMPSVTEIRANRPFYYQIVEHETNTVLFAGVVRNPKD